MPPDQRIDCGDDGPLLGSARATSDTIGCGRRILGPVSVVMNEVLQIASSFYTVVRSARAVHWEIGAIPPLRSDLSGRQLPDQD
jgi:hypothetical protein